MSEAKNVYLVISYTDYEGFDRPIFVGSTKQSAENYINKKHPHAKFASQEDGDDIWKDSRSSDERRAARRHNFEEEMNQSIYGDELHVIQVKLD